MEFHCNAIVTVAGTAKPPYCLLIAGSMRFFPKDRFYLDWQGLKLVRIFGMLGSTSPEPATMFLFGTGLIGLAGLTRRRMQR